MFPWFISFNDRYYSGEKKAPYLTVFIGGNHEASNYLQELPYGGWVAPNIYYMGMFPSVRSAHWLKNQNQTHKLNVETFFWFILNASCVIQWRPLSCMHTYIHILNDICPEYTHACKVCWYLPICECNS